MSRQPRFRTPKPYGERSEKSESVQPRKTFYLICEGKKTEKQYFEGVFQNRRVLGISNGIDIVVMEQEGDHVPHPMYLVDECVNIISDDKIREEKLPNYNREIDEICIIFDRDPDTLSEEQIVRIRDGCSKSNIEIGFTNPNFEFWLLLHFERIEDYSRDVLLENRKIGKKRYIEKELSEKMGGYKKSSINFSYFLYRVDTAIEQERQFEQTIEGISNNLGSNIGLLMTRFRES